MALTRILIPEQHDLGGFSVYRSLPHRDQDMVGPFIFLDHLGPAVFPPGEGVDVRPHPHINLATVTYLFEGSLLHRDSLGVVQEIIPGEVNWMTAGKGIVHSERSPDSFRAAESTLHAIQTWIALPTEFEEIEPDFSHYSDDKLPQWQENGTKATLLAGEFDKYSSPVQTFSPTIYLSLLFSAGSRFSLPEDDQQKGIYSVAPGLSVGGKPLEQNRLAIVEPGTAVEISADTEAQAIVIGGKPLGFRQKYWNFVSSRLERIEQAKQDWKENRFPQVPNESGFIPLPTESSDHSSGNDTSDQPDESDTSVHPLS